MFCAVWSGEKKTRLLESTVIGPMVERRPQSEGMLSVITSKPLLSWPCRLLCARSPMVEENVANALGSELLVELDVICPAPAAMEAAPPTAVVTPPKIAATFEPSSITPATFPSPGIADSSDETPPTIETIFCQLVLTTVCGGGG